MRVRAGLLRLSVLRADGGRLSSLFDQAVRLRRYRESALGDGHFESRFRTQRLVDLTLGIPAGIKGRESCFPASSSVSHPPIPELLVPALSVFGAAYPYMSSPYGCVSMCSHHNLLLAYLVLLQCVRPNLPTA